MLFNLKSSDAIITFNETISKIPAILQDLDAKIAKENEIFSKNPTDKGNTDEGEILSHGRRNFEAFAKYLTTVTKVLINSEAESVSLDIEEMDVIQVVKDYEI